MIYMYVYVLYICMYKYVCAQVYLQEHAQITGANTAESIKYKMSQ